MTNKKLKRGVVFLGAVLGLGAIYTGCGDKPAAVTTSAPTAPAAAPATNGAAAPKLLTLQPPAPTAPRIILYNGIALNPPWPPRYPAITAEPLPVPYLRESPAVVPIDVGRQLFVDDFLIDSVTNLKRNFHAAEYYPGNPVVKADQPWESEGGKASALASDGGVWYDQSDKLFKMWYSAAGGQATCFAYSTNGTNWEKPRLEVVKDSNIVLKERNYGESVWMDVFTTNPLTKFRMFRQDEGGRIAFHTSSNGIHWGGVETSTPPAGKGANVFYNPVRRYWGFNLGADGPAGLVRKYWETQELGSSVNWGASDPVWWTGVDKFDLAGGDGRNQMLGLTVIPYESLMVGLFTMGDGKMSGQGKGNKIQVGFSRDGFHWIRPDRRIFLPQGEDMNAWNGGDMYASPGSFLMVGRRLHFYLGGRSADGKGSTGLATLRRDGFASMDAETNTTGILTTWPVVFRGKYLFVNVDNPNGSLAIEALDQNNQVIEPFSRTNSVPITMDTTLVLANWNGEKDLSKLTGKPVKFRFHLTNGKLYSFWVGPSYTGASGGFLAGGGPHYNQQIDSIGNGSYRALPNITNFPAILNRLPPTPATP